MKDQKKIETFDIAIVGGGVAGCYAAYRLSQAHYNVVLFEKSHRIGGRLKSEQKASVIAEMGGMRFFEEIHILKALIEHLGMTDEIADFTMDQANTYFYARHTKIRRSEVASVKLPYNLKSSEKNKTPYELELEVIHGILPEFKKLRNQYHEAIKRKDQAKQKELLILYKDFKKSTYIAGTPLYKYSWYQMLKSRLSEEAISLLQDFGGYEIKRSNGGAANWLDNIFFTPKNVQLKRLTCGFDALPKKLHALFEQTGGTTYLKHELKEVKKEGVGYSLRFNHQGKTKSMIAKKVILALPKPAIEKLQTSFLKSSKFQKALESVQSIDAFKLFLVYPYAWWKQLGITKGRSTTDLPLRQVYYYKETDKNALLMASYCNGSDVLYWSAFDDDQKMMKEAHRQLTLMHSDIDIPDPIEISYQFWKAESGTSGWHVWQPNVNEENVIKSMQQPSPSDDVFIVGACWSEEPGSVQGAIQTAECLMQNKFELKALF